MRAYDIILKKRNNIPNTKEEIEFMIQGYIKGNIPDYQISSWLMAIYFNHLSSDERFYLTNYMLESGDKVDLSEIKGKKIDKHSTGGVGDKVSLCIAPMVASLGLKISKLSGRGLGHTGGTIDKLDAIPGFRTDLTKEEFFNIANESGIVIAGQTANIAPADKKLYGLRDATATVDEISLIASSVMSKKLAINSDGLLLDVKAGSGAFMKTVDEAIELAEIMVDISKKASKKVIALVTNMNQPLGNYVGNSLEILESINVVKGFGPKDLTELSIEISSYMAELSGEYSYKEAKNLIKENIKNGIIKEIMEKWIVSQNGDKNVVRNPEKCLKISDKIYELTLNKSGVIEKMNTENCGIASMLLGAGRTNKDDEIDLSVGIQFVKKLGDTITSEDIVAKLFYSEKSQLDEAIDLLRSSYLITDNLEPFEPQIIHKIIK